MPHALAGRTVALCVTGSIAAYKAVLVARLLVQARAIVMPVMTASASKFVGAATLAGITGQSVKVDMWDGSPGEIHVELGSRADAILVVPATADILARFAEGRADDLVTALVLCAKGPVLAAPAMHPRMWEHPATRRNIEELRSLGRVSLVGPVDGPVASGDSGMGRLAEPEAIVDALLEVLSSPSPRQTQASPSARPLAPARSPKARDGESIPAPRVDLLGLKLVVTAGPTTEDLDPVRFVGNRSSGKMGFAVAERAAARGARVTLVAGPVALSTPTGVSRIDVRTALEMQKALALVMGSELEDVDALIMSAAVADYRPRAPSTEKLKRTSKPLVLELVPNPDLLADIGARRTNPRPFLVGFALETERGDALVELARNKLRKKKVDLIVANPAGEALSRDDNHATLVTETETTALGVMAKTELADVILDRIREAMK